MTAQLQPTDSGYFLSGRLDNQHTNAIFQLLPAPSNKTDVLDLNSLEHIDSAGLALLVLWSNRQKAAGGALELSNIPQQAQQMMEILGLHEIL